MQALRTAPPLFSVADAARIARDIYGLTADIDPLPGERDCNFRLRSPAAEFVLKILGTPAGVGADACVRVLAHLAEQDPTLPVPRLAHTREGGELGSLEWQGQGFATCLLSYLPGRALSDTAQATALLEPLGGMLARLDAALRGFFHPGLGQRLAWDVRLLPELWQLAQPLPPAVAGLVAGQVQALRGLLPALRGLRSQAIHGDCHPGNIVVDPTGPTLAGVLDFGDMIHAPLILEPAVAMSELLTEGTVPAGGLAALLAGYAAFTPLLHAEVETLFDLITARHAVVLVLHAWRIRHDHGGAAILAAAAERAADSLGELSRLGRRELTAAWHEAAGTAQQRPRPVDVARRHRLLGAGAELFYAEPLHLVRASGAWLHDAHGNAYLDVYNNVPHVGHAHPAVVRAIHEQTAALATHTRYLHSGILDYAEALTARCPRHLDACMFVNSGSEANDLAWRLAQFASGASGAVVMAHAYHGVTAAAALLTPGAGVPGDPRVATLALPPAGTWDAEWSAEQSAAVTADADGAVAALQARGFAPAAFFIDSALTSSGIHDPPAQWGRTVAQRLRAAGSLVVADEVQIGLGRAGSHFWGFERRGIEPDIVTLGKPIGNGYPMGAVIASRALIEAFQARVGFFSTFGGNPVAAAAGLAVLQVLERERLQENARRVGAYLTSRLAALGERHGCLGRVRGSGLLLGLEVRGVGGNSAQATARRMVDRMAGQSRVLTGVDGPHSSVLKLRPPLPFDRSQADLLLHAIEAAADAAAADAAAATNGW